MPPAPADPGCAQPRPTASGVGRAMVRPRRSRATTSPTETLYERRNYESTSPWSSKPSVSSVGQTRSAPRDPPLLARMLCRFDDFGASLQRTRQWCDGFHDRARLHPEECARRADVSGETYDRDGFIRDGTEILVDSAHRSGRRGGQVDDGIASGIAPERAAWVRQNERRLMRRWPSRRSQRIKRHRVLRPDGRIEASPDITRTFGQSASSPSGSNSSRATV
jgi:hypothetical protein